MGYELSSENSLRAKTNDFTLKNVYGKTVKADWSGARITFSLIYNINL